MPPDGPIAAPNKARHVEWKKCRKSGCHARDKTGLRRRVSACRQSFRLALSRRPLLALELLAGLFGALLQVVLQLLLLFLEHFRVGGRAVIGLAEIGERKRNADELTLAVDTLH